MTGLHDVDEYIQAQLLLAVRNPRSSQVSVCVSTLIVQFLSGSEHHNACPQTWRDVRGKGQFKAFIQHLPDTSTLNVLEHVAEVFNGGGMFKLLPLKCLFSRVDMIT